MRWPLLALILLAVPAANAAVINEIMYDPDKCSDADCEWIELYNPAAEEINLTYWYADGKNISVASVPANAYLIIAKDKNSFLENYGASCTAIQTAISLSNNETLYLNNSHKSFVDSAAYDFTIGGNGNDKTLSLANGVWRESLLADGTPCAQNFQNHKIDLSLEQTDTNEITARLANSGLSDENITLNFYVDGNFSQAHELELASFGSGDITLTAENVSAGKHIALANATFSSSSVSAELNFSNALPNADVYATVTINKTSNEYIIRSFPENASTYVGVAVFPHNFNGSDIIFGLFMFGEEFDKNLDVSDLVSEEIDFGTYDLCAEVTDVNNYNDTDLENNFACEEFTIGPPASQTRKRIKTFAENESYGLNETIFWSAQIFPLANGTVGNLTVSLQKRNSQTSQEILKIENLNLTENLVLSGNVTIPDDAIEGIYKIRAKFSYSSKQFFDSQDSGQLWLNGLKDIGQANITFIKYPSALQFGSFGAIFIKFYAGNYNYNKIRLLAYGSPSQVLRDLNQEGLTTSDAPNASVAFEIESVKRGQEIYVALPAFTQQNCDSNYVDKNYRVRVRAYQPSQTGWSEITTSDITVPISGKDTLCVSETKKTSGNSGRNIVLTKKPKEKNNVLEVISAPDSAGQGEFFTAEIKLTNNLNATESFEVYSYVFEGREIMTEGGWTGNSQMVKLKSKESQTITLDNVVKEDARLGQHTLRIRAKSGKSTEDADREIEIAASREQEAEAGFNVQGQSQEIPITAAAVWRTSKGGNMNVAAVILIIVLLVITFALIKSK